MQEPLRVSANLIGVIARSNLSPLRFPPTHPRRCVLDFRPRTAPAALSCISGGLMVNWLGGIRIALGLVVWAGENPNSRSPATYLSVRVPPISFYDVDETIPICQLLPPARPHDFDLKDILSQRAIRIVLRLDDRVARNMHFNAGTVFCPSSNQRWPPLRLPAHRAAF
ncbi:hypothetical protein C8R43DRAFT_1235269 [Mycena crocata]|nr:hypothetical protein C8R43DRAFT_1235269 [Mycena crocata]